MPSSVVAMRCQLHPKPAIVRQTALEIGFPRQILYGFWFRPRYDARHASTFQDRLFQGLLRIAGADSLLLGYSKAVQYVSECTDWSIWH